MKHTVDDESELDYRVIGILFGLIGLVIIGGIAVSVDEVGAVHSEKPVGNNNLFTLDTTLSDSPTLLEFRTIPGNTNGALFGDMDAHGFYHDPTNWEIRVCHEPYLVGKSNGMWILRFRQ